MQDRLTIAVLGAGVAGSIVAYLLIRRGFNNTLTVYEVHASYTKPCGEAIPYSLLELLEGENIPKPQILNRIHKFEIYVKNVKVKTVEFDKPAWLIIDKHSWINRLRKLIGNRLVVSRGPQGEDIIIDARGPWSSKNSKIVVWQAYMQHVASMDETAYLLFSVRPFGLVWIFPHGDLLNVGGGFVGYSRPRNLSINLIEKVLGNRLRIVRESYAPLTIPPRIDFGRGNVVKVGEAAGLVLSLGGEGIRPAVVSAIALARAVAESVSFPVTVLRKNYVHDTRLKRVVEQVKIHNLLIGFARRLTENTVASLLNKLDVDIYWKWFTGSLAASDVLRVMPSIIASSLLRWKI